MITSEEARKKALLIRHGNQRYHYDEIEVAYSELLDYITQQEELTTTVKRYFELETLIDTHDYMPSEEEIQEYFKVREKTVEMVGIKE